MAKQSAGILPFRTEAGIPEVFLVHPGGPFWAKKDVNAWSAAKGEFEDEEDALAAARREFREETGFEVYGEFIQLSPVKQAGGKIVYTWAVEANFDAAKIRSNTFAMEWPPRSGRTAEFPEIDKAAWFPYELAREKILKGQLPALDELFTLLKTTGKV